MNCRIEAKVSKVFEETNLVFTGESNCSITPNKTIFSIIEHERKYSPQYHLNSTAWMNCFV